MLAIGLINRFYKVLVHQNGRLFYDSYKLKIPWIHKGFDYIYRQFSTKMMRIFYFQRFILLSIIVLLISANPGVAQNNTKPFHINNQWNELHLEKSSREDPLLVNGRIYRLFKPNAQNDPFLFSTSWHPATVYVKGQTFPNRQVKYDIYQDALILKIQNATANYDQIRLNGSFVDSFLMADNHKFIHSRNLGFSDLNVNYVEMIAAGRISMVRTHKKGFIEIYNNFAPQGSYGDTNSKEYLIQNGKLINVSKKRLYLRAFDDNKRTIRKYMRKNDIVYRKVTKNQLINLMNYCNALVE